MSNTNTDIVLPYGDSDGDRSVLVVPARAPIAMKGVTIELDPAGQNARSWDFGDTDRLPRSNMLARDADGNALETNGDALFPGDFEDDVDYQRLLRYLDVADREAFSTASDDITLFPASQASVGAYVVERPTVADAADAAAFDPRRLRIWRAGEAWNGISLAETAVDDGLIPTGEFEPFLRAAAVALRSATLRTAIRHALAPFSGTEELLESCLSLVV